MDIMRLDSIGVSDLVVSASYETPLSVQLVQDLGDGVFTRKDDVRDMIQAALRSALEGE